MRRAVQALLAVAFAVLAVLAFFVGRPGRETPNRIDLAPASTAPFLEEATIRNVTKKPVAYTIRAGRPGTAPRTRLLSVGAVDRLATADPVEISFDSGGHMLDYLVHPGRPYSFRYDEKGAVRLYPGAHGREDAADLAPYVPTPPEVVARMIELAAVGPKDVVYDLGCGDGRMVIAAAKSRGCRGVGIELDPALIEECRAAAKREGVESLVRFLQQDAAKAGLSGATVLLLYLLPESLEALAPAFERDLPPGARIVSHDYRIPGWDARIAATDVLPGDGGRDHRVILYRLPGTR